MTSIADDEDLILRKDELTTETHFGPSRKGTIDVICLTLGLGGLQGIFAVQFGNGSAYMTSLGLSKPVMALVWLAGPVSGAILQPYFGLCSDSSQSRWGRRHPFVVGGSAAIILSLLGLAWAEKLVSGVFNVFGAERQESVVKTCARLIAILFVFALNIAVQPVQGGLRALIVDSCPGDQQDSANAWAGRIISIANISTYLCGYIDLPHWLPYLGQTQFQVLSVITSLVLTITVGIMCLTVKETPARNLPMHSNKEGGLLRRFRFLTRSFGRLPSRGQRVCIVQFFAWMGWFPFLFYVNIYIGEKYLKSSSPYASLSHKIATSATETEIAERIGPLGMLLVAILSLLAGIALPLLGEGKQHIVLGRRPSSLIARCMDYVSAWSGSTRRLWMISHILFAACMLATLFVSSLAGTCILVGLAGISWAVTIWAPYAIISTSVLADVDLNALEYSSSEGHRDTPQLGTVVGLHNVAIAVPQIVAALVCGFVFWMADLVGIEDSIGWVLRLGGVCALVAATLTSNVESMVWVASWEEGKLSY